MNTKFWLSFFRMKSEAKTVVLNGFTRSGCPSVNHSNGLLKAIEKFLRDPISYNWRMGLAEENGNYWSVSVNHDLQNGNVLFARLDPQNRKLSLAFMDSTGALRAYDEAQRTPYESLLPVIGYLWSQQEVLIKGTYKWESQKEIAKLVADYRASGSVSDTDELQALCSAVYYIGKDILPEYIEDIEELRDIVTEGRDISKEIFSESSAYFFEDTSATVAPSGGVVQNIVNGKMTANEAMAALKAKYSPYTANFLQGRTQEQEDATPKDSDIANYIPNEKFEDICALIADNLQRGCKNNNIMLWGPPGSGKSAVARALAYVFQLPYYFEQGFDSKDAGDYQGTTIAVNGQLHTTTDTPFVRCMGNGGVFADDDFNYGKAGEQVFKNSILEEPFKAKLANLDEVVRSPFAIYIATANPNCEGAREIPPAFKNRSYIDMYWEPLEDVFLIKHIKNASGFEDEAVIEKMVEAYHAINTAIGDGLEKKEEAYNLTPRNLVAWATHTRVFGSPLKAANTSIYGALGENASKEFLKRVKETMLEPRFKN